MKTKHQTQTKYQTREEWLIAATELLRPLFKQHGHEIPPVRVSCGWPSRKATAAKNKAVGQCWDASAAADKQPQIFISPFVSVVNGEDGVLGIHAHELIHAIFGTDEGHGKKFGALARGIGLEGKLTSTTPSKELQKHFATLELELGAYPHSKLNPLKSGIKKQTTRLLKYECPECGYCVRITQKWVDDVGAPCCPAHDTLVEGKPKEKE